MTATAADTARTSDEVIATGGFKARLPKAVALVQLVPQLRLRRYGVGMFAQFYLVGNDMDN